VDSLEQLLHVAGATPVQVRERVARPREDDKFWSMSDLRFAEGILERLMERTPRFHGKAYLFLLTALHAVLDSLEERRHISGEELADGVRKLALQHYGPMARIVLAHWGIHSTEDLGEIVFAMVECGILEKQEKDRMEDFRALFDFEEAFELDYPWGCRF
jgi:uncharacterized repeat protein (TIGR04138 family)